MSSIWLSSNKEVILCKLWVRFEKCLPIESKKYMNEMNLLFRYRVSKFTTCLMEQMITRKKKTRHHIARGWINVIHKRATNLEKVKHIFTDSRLIMPNVSQVTAVAETSSDWLIDKDYVWDLPTKFPQWMQTVWNTELDTVKSLTDHWNN